VESERVTFNIAKRFPKKKTITIQNFPIINKFKLQVITPCMLCDPVIVYIGSISIIREIREMVKAIGLIPADLRAHLIIASSWKI